MTRLKQGYDGLNIPTPYQKVVLLDNPIAYWRLGDTGSVVADSSGNGYVGSVSSTGVTEGQPGIVGGDTSMLFDGVAGWINMGNPTGLIPGSSNGLSFEFWIKYTIGNLANGTWIGGRCSVYPTLQTGDESYGMELSWNIAGDIAFSISRDGSANVNLGGSRKVLASPLAYNDGEPHHVVGTYGAPVSGQTMSLYVDGQVVIQQSWAVGPIWPPSGGASSNIQFAKPPSNSFGMTYLPGTLDEIAVYNFELSAARVLAHYNAGRPVVAYVSSTDRSANTVSAYDYL